VAFSFTKLYSVLLVHTNKMFCPVPSCLCLREFIQKNISEINHASMWDNTKYTINQYRKPWCNHYSHSVLTPTILLLPIDPKQELHTHTHTISTRFGHGGVGGCVICAFLFTLRLTKKGERHTCVRVCARVWVCVCVCILSPIRWLSVWPRGLFNLRRSTEAPAKIQVKKWDIIII